MNLPLSVTQEELSEVLLNVAPVRPVYIWGAPGIGKSALVEQFAEKVGLPCVSLLGSQLAPEDIIGIPQVKGETSEFLPPKMIARKEPYVLFLDELNACSQEVQKAFYSLIYEKRVGEYHLPEGSIIIGAGNRMQDGAIVKTMSSALLNRMFHVQMKVDATQWLTWAYQNDIPDPDGSKLADSVIAEYYKNSIADTIPLTGFNEKLERRQELSELIGRMDMEKKKIEQELKLYLGENERAENEQFMVSWKSVQSNRLDEKRLKEEEPEIYEKYKKSVSSRRFTVKAA